MQTKPVKTPLRTFQVLIVEQNQANRYYVVFRMGRRISYTRVSKRDFETEAEAQHYGLKVQMIMLHGLDKYRLFTNLSKVVESFVEALQEVYEVFLSAAKELIRFVRKVYLHIQRGAYNQLVSYGVPKDIAMIFVFHAPPYLVYKMVMA